MQKLPSSNSLSASVRIYRALLAAYPRTFRERYETQMVQVFRDSFRGAYGRHGTPGVADLWLHTFGDLLVTALMERLGERSGLMLSPKFIIGGSVAASFGGIMWIAPVLGGQSTNITFPLALLLTLVGLAAFQARLGTQAGWMGWAGFMLSILGTGVLVWYFVTGMMTDIVQMGLIILGVGTVMVALRMRQARILYRPGALMLLVIGLLQIGMSLSIWLMYSLAADPWNPMSVGAIAALLMAFCIGILWVLLGGILAQDAALQDSGPPPAAA